MIGSLISPRKIWVKVVQYNILTATPSQSTLRLVLPPLHNQSLTIYPSKIFYAKIAGPSLPGEILFVSAGP